MPVIVLTGAWVEVGRGTKSTRRGVRLKDQFVFSDLVIDSKHCVDCPFAKLDLTCHQKQKDLEN